MAEDSMRILERLRKGEITADEAERLLTGLGAGIYDPDDSDRMVAVLPKGKAKGITYTDEIPRFTNFWQWIFASGVALFMVFGLAVTSLASFFALLCFGPFVLAGFGLAAIGLWSRSSHWLHVHVKDSDGTNIRISLPFPIGLASWILRMAKPTMRGHDMPISGEDLVEMIRLMGDELSPENPIMVAVDDDDDQVLVYIT
jgi:hypothetical protein